MGVKIEPCPFCGTAWIYASVGDYGSGYEYNGYRIECKCGFAWKTIKWHDSRDEVIKEWNEKLLGE